MKANTLLISADGTYPGIVLEMNRPALQDNPNWVRVKWYKWGYRALDAMDDIELVSSVINHVVTPEQVKAKFGALPPEYVPDIRTHELYDEDEMLEEVERELRSRANCIMAEATDGTEIDQEAAIQSLVHYVWGLLR